jgi:O-succinylbenzoate synthase
MTNPATAEEIRSILGEIAPIACEQIQQTDATVDELVEAYAAFEADRNGESRRSLSPRVAAVLSILEDELDDLEEREWNYPIAAG